MSSAQGSRLFVGSLPWAIKNDDLRHKFEEFGQVEDAFVVTDRATGRSRGFGFVTFENEQDAENAIKGLDNTEIDGRVIKVDKASQNDRQQGSHRKSEYGSRGGSGRDGSDRRDNYRRDDRRGGARDGGSENRDRRPRRRDDGDQEEKGYSNDNRDD